MAHITIWLPAAITAAGLANAALAPRQDMNTVDTNINVGELDNYAVNSQHKFQLLDLPSEILQHIVGRLSYSAMDQFKATARLADAHVHDRKDRHGGVVFFNVRSFLDLPPVQGSLTFVGLRTLLEADYFAIAMAIPTFLAYLDPRTPIEVRDQLEREFPDLFQKYSFRGLVLPDFVQPWLLGLFEAVLYQDRTDHSLHSLGRRLNIAKLLRVIEALFSVVTSDDLLDNIRAMTEQAMQEQQGTPATNAISPMPEAIEPVQLQHFKPFVYWFWLKVIGGGNIYQLRYYLGNLLALRTIPYIFAEMLQSGRNDDVLKLAQSVSQLPGFIQAVNAYPANAPNYFEFIVMYAIGWQVAGYVDLAHAAQRAGTVNVERLYLCAMQDLPDYPWNKLVETFHLELPADPDTWQYENDLQCMLFLSSLDRNFLLP